MKKLTVYALALLLITGTTAALAGGKNHGAGRSSYKGHGGQMIKHQSHNKHYYKSNHRNKFRHGYGWGYRPQHAYGRPYGSNYYYSSYLGTAMLGTAFGSSLYHTHSGAPCYDDHTRFGITEQTAPYKEVIGCHRIERLPDGSEQRVELPLSQCQ